MDLDLYIKQLCAERDRVDNTILALQGIALQQTDARPGRPRKGMADAVAALASGHRRGRPPGKGKSTTAKKRLAAKTK